MKSPATQKKCLRVAWLFPSLARAFYWHPVLAELAKIYPEMIVFTGAWPGFAKHCERAFIVEEIGKYKFLSFSKSSSGYDRGIILPSLKIVPRLLQFEAQVIVTVAFSLWTLIAVILKPWAKWKIVIFFEGDSPTVGGTKSGLRKFMRCAIAKFTSAFVTNSQAGKFYLVQQLAIGEDKIFVRPTEVPDPSIAICPEQGQPILPDLSYNNRPIFIFIGQLIKRKGISYLLDACNLLNQNGHKEWNLMIVGDGPNRVELEAHTRAMGLEDLVHWVGWIRNENLGRYLRFSDVFVFPTLEDTWGVAVLEAMLFDKPILCSDKAGAVELIEHGSNGFVFDPRRPEVLAELMQIFIDSPERIISMGKHSGESIRSYTPTASANYLADVIESVTKGNL